MARVRLGHSDWATKDRKFKVMETHRNDVTGDLVEWGTLNVFGKYFRVTQASGEGIKKYTRSINQQYRMGLISEAEYINYKERLLEDLETKRVGSNAPLRGGDIGKTSVFFENLMKRTGISDKLFKKENLQKMSQEQQRIVKEFKKNMKALNKDIVMQQDFYDVVSQYFKNVSAFYELQKQQGGKLTQEQIEDMVSNLDWLNKRYDAMKQTKLDRYGKI